MTSVRPRTGLVLSVLFVSAIGAGMAQGKAVDVHRWLDCDISRISSDNNSGPNFTAKVTFHEDPVSSVRVLLAREDSELDESAWSTVATSETDHDGIARFFAIPSGKYRIRVGGALLTPSEEITVDAEDPAAPEISFEWPEKYVQASKLFGRVVLSHQATQKPMPHRNVLVELLDLRTARLLAQTHTSDDGAYEFTPSDPGVYVLRFNEGPDDLNSDYEQMAVEIRDDAINSGLPVLKIAKTKCTSGISQPPDERLFERAMSAVDHNRFTVANLSLQTLINTYPNSEFAEKSKLVLRDTRIAKCGESYIFLPSDCEGSLAATRP